MIPFRYPHVLCHANVFPSLYTIRDPSKDKPFELEVGWLCAESEWQFALAPAALV